MLLHDGSLMAKRSLARGQLLNYGSVRLNDDQRTQLVQVHASAAPPSMEDLLALNALFGNDPEGIVAFLARLWRATSSDIRPTVRTWLDALPPMPPPPSRSRTAPPVLPHGVEARLERARPSHLQL